MGREASGRILCPIFWLHSNRSSFRSWCPGQNNSTDSASLREKYALSQADRTKIPLVWEFSGP